MTSIPEAVIAEARAAIASVADGSRARMRRAVARLFDSMDFMRRKLSAAVSSGMVGPPRRNPL
jgi:hypothetical protein